MKGLSYAGSSSKQSIGEALSNAVGSVGENMAIPRGVGMILSESTDEHSRLMAYCHMSTAGTKRRVGDVQFGKYVAIVRYRPVNGEVRLNCSRIINYVLLIIFHKCTVVYVYCCPPRKEAMPGKSKPLV